MLAMVSYSRRPQSGQITCYLKRTYHVLLSRYAVLTLGTVHVKVPAATGSVTGPLYHRSGRKRKVTPRL